MTLFRLTFFFPSLSQKMTLWYDIIRETLVTLRGGDRTGLRDACIRRRRTIESMSSASPSLGSKSRSSKDMSSSGSKTRDSKGTPPLSKEVRKKEHELHQQLDKLQKENSEIKAKLASVADDSEKLGGLKVINFVVYARVCLSILLILHPTYTDGAANARGGKTTGEVGSGIGRRQND